VGAVVLSDIMQVLFKITSGRANTKQNRQKNDMGYVPNEEQYRQTAGLPSRQRENVNIENRQLLKALIFRCKTEINPIDTLANTPINCPCILQRKWGENPPLARNCNWENSVTSGHWETGKADGKTALKPGDFGLHAASYRAGYFFLASRKKPEKSRIHHYKDSLSPPGMFGLLTKCRLMIKTCARWVSFFEEGAFYVSVQIVQSWFISPLFDAGRFRPVGSACRILGYGL